MEKDRINQSTQAMLDDLRERASKDGLSGLLNRTTAEHYIRERLQGAAQGERCAMLIVDLDNFKQVNDTLGHQTGDQVIRHSARILSGLFRASDVLGRLGGDEFIAFFSGQLDEAAISRKAQAVCDSLQISLEGPPPLYLSASVGVSVHTGTGHFEELYQAADRALYQVKRNGKGTFHVSKDGADAGEVRKPSESMNMIPMVDLLESMESGVALLEMADPMRVIYMGRSFYQALRAKSDSISLPIPIAELIHPDDLPELEQALLDGVCDGGPVEHTLRISIDRQTWFWWRIRAVRLACGRANPVMLITTTDVSRSEENAQQIQYVKERVQTAFAQTGRHLWEVDLAAKTLSIFDAEKGFHTPDAVLQDFPERFIAEGVVHPDSVPLFRAFSAALLDGQAQGCGNFIMRHRKSGNYGWVTVSYQMLYNDAGRAVRAVGLLGQPVQLFDRNHLKRPLPSILQPEIVAALSANLTQNRMETFWSEGKELWEDAGRESCDTILAQEEGRIFFEDDKIAFGPCFRREAMLERFAAGHRWVVARYRRVDRNGSIQWVAYMANLAEDPVSRDVYIFLCISNISHWVALEEKLPEGVQWDPVTQIYNRATVSDLIAQQSLLGNGALAGMAVIYLGGSGKQEGTGAPESIRFRLASAFVMALGPRCLIGQYGPDKLLVFFPEVCSKFDLRGRLEDAFAFVRNVLSTEFTPESLRFVAGAICYAPEEMADYRALIQERLAYTCELWHNTPSDTVIFPKKEDDWTWIELWADSENDTITTEHGADSDAPLPAGEANLAVQCAMRMLSANSLKASVVGVLECIGKYCAADRVYILNVSEGTGIVTMPYEWIAPGRHSVQAAMSGMSVAKFLPLRRCLEERKTVLLERPASDTVGKTDSWRFAIYPMPAKQEFMCIENAGRYPKGAVLTEVLLPQICQEKGRFQRLDQQMEQPFRFLMDMPNQFSYIEAAHDFDSDRLSSLGVVYVQLSEIEAINDGFGFQTGLDIMWHTVQSMLDLFGKENMFRMGYAEFTLLCPNITQSVFSDRCERLRRRLQGGGKPQVGYTWASGAFQGRRLVQEAKALMQYSGAPDETSIETMALPGGASCRILRDAISGGSFTIYLQPKIDMRTGSLHGAEALVRGLDADGNPISPGKFIPYLEKNGKIRELDHFVLEKTFSTLERWREEGWPLTPISVNLSRVTLFHQSTPAAILAIWSRYPNVPLDAVELEITESAGSVENMNLTEVTERFREFGLHFALDDFGSEYSNISVFTNVKFDVVKLDRSLVAGLNGNPINQMLIRSIADICRSCGMECVAEGVENQAQADALLEAGCLYAQGFYYDRPIPVDKFETKYFTDRRMPV